MDVLTAVDEQRITAGGRPFWLDLVDPSPAEVERVGGLLGLHPVALEDTREFGQRPKVDAYEDNVLLVFYTARLGDALSPEPIEVHVYVAAGYVLTVRRAPCVVLDDLRERVSEGGEHPVYQILDTLTDAFYPVIEGLEQRIDALEWEVLARARRAQLETIYRLRQDVRELGRIAISQRDQFQEAAAELRATIEAADDVHEYLRDIGDHLAQVAGELHRQNEDLAALTSTYFNANADRLNAVATRLTVLGMLFVLWTLITGFFGQNFAWLTDHVESRSDFLLFGLGGLLVPTVILLTVLWVKRHDWF
jgi:magnesium transporter